MLCFRVGARTHTGLVRANNEDSGYAGASLLLVADGVGGHAAGEVASASVTYLLSSYAMRAELVRDPVSTLRTAVERAYAHLRDGVRDDPRRAGMATTLTAVLTDGATAALAHVGDSRAYLLRSGGMRQLTHDDTFVQALVDAGNIDAAAARRHPHRNVVLESVNPEGTPNASVSALELRVGDRLLLCSDGLTDYLDDATIAPLLATGSADDAADLLVDQVLRTDAADNVTCVTADVGEIHLAPGTPLPGAGRCIGAFVDPGSLIDPAAPVAAG